MFKVFFPTGVIKGGRERCDFYFLKRVGCIFMEFLFLCIFFAIGLAGLRLLFYSMRENIRTNAEAKREIAIMKKEAELKELRHHKYDINEKFDDFDDYE